MACGGLMTVEQEAEAKIYIVPTSMQYSYGFIAVKTLGLGGTREYIVVPQAEDGSQSEI
jgi:hypothetical protein